MYPGMENQKKLYALPASFNAGAKKYEFQRPIMQVTHVRNLRKKNKLICNKEIPT